MMRAALALALALTSTGGMASEIAGKATVFDSTTIEIDGQRIMLFGIDSIMRKQSCMANGKVWPCWEAAVRDLQTLVSQGAATCEVEPERAIRPRRIRARKTERDDGLCRRRGRGKRKEDRSVAGTVYGAIRVSDEGRHFRRTPLTPRPARWAAISLGLGGVAGIIRVKVGRRDRWEGKHDP
jgi:hypothetical protein